MTYNVFGGTLSVTQHEPRKASAFLHALWLRP